MLIPVLEDMFFNLQCRSVDYTKKKKHPKTRNNINVDFQENEYILICLYNSIIVCSHMNKPKICKYDYSSHKQNIDWKSFQNDTYSMMSLI